VVYKTLQRTDDGGDEMMTFKVWEVHFYLLLYDHVLSKHWKSSL